MATVTASQLAGWAIGGNIAARLEGNNDEVAWLPGGQTRLRRLALWHAQMFALCSSERLQQWDQYLDYLGLLAHAVRDGVFRDHGAVTAAHLVLCVLAHEGFCLTAGPIGDDLLAQIREGTPLSVSRLLKERYRRPAGAAE